MDKQLTIRLVLVLAVYGALTFSGRKGWLRSKELAWVGGAIIFWAGGTLLQVVVPMVHGKYPVGLQALWISIGLVLPVIISLIFGLWYLIKKVRTKESA